jgi:hypothetical protein
MTILGELANPYRQEPSNQPVLKTPMLESTRTHPNFTPDVLSFPSSHFMTYHNYAPST